MDTVIKTNKNTNLASTVVLFLIALIFLYLMVKGNNYCFIYLFIFPVILFHLKGHKKGAIFSTGFIFIQFMLFNILENIPWIFKFLKIYNNINLINSLITGQIIISVVMYFTTKNYSEQYNLIRKENRQKIDFFIHLAHETKTPLTIIQSYMSKYIEKHGSTPEIAFIKNNLDKLRRDMVNFLDKEKLERNQIFYNHNQVSDLAWILKSKILLFKEISDKKNIKISSSIDKRLLAKVDPHAIDRILNNLIDNAIRYNRNDGSIQINAKRTGSIIKLIIKDNGIGIALDKQKNIFKSFYQISHKKQSIQGTGMGLTIVKKIIDQINGKIKIVSKEGKGTEFIITLNANKPNDYNNTEQLSKLSRPFDNLININLSDSEYNQNLYNVFVIENNLQMLYFLKNILSENFNFYYAQNGKSALKKIKRIPRPDLIVSDIIMNEMDGFEIYNQILKADEDFACIPFIFLTARDSHEDRLKGFSMGAEDFISKPFHAEELLFRIKSKIENIEIRKTYNSNKLKTYLHDIFSNKKIRKKEVKLESHLSRSITMKYKISKREMDVISLIKEGFEYKEIASKLNISVNTVETYRRRIFKKCQVATKLELLNIFE